MCGPILRSGGRHDNDGNGYIDDIHGWDFFSNDNSTYDGTRGRSRHARRRTIGAEAGTDAGVAAVNWQLTLVSTKSSDDGRSTSDAVRAAELSDRPQAAGTTHVV